jgi:hypothetical protein
MMMLWKSVAWKGWPWEGKQNVWILALKASCILSNQKCFLLLTNSDSRIGEHFVLKHAKTDSYQLCFLFLYMISSQISTMTIKKYGYGLFHCDQSLWYICLSFRTIIITVIDNSPSLVGQKQKKLCKFSCFCSIMFVLKQVTTGKQGLFV